MAHSDTFQFVPQHFHKIKEQTVLSLNIHQYKPYTAVEVMFQKVIPSFITKCATLYLIIPPVGTAVKTEIVWRRLVFQF